MTDAEELCNAKMPTLPEARGEAPEEACSADGLLVERLRRGDADAGYHFFRDYYPSVYRYLFWLTQRPEQAEDLAQETFLRAWRHLDAFDPRGSLRAWLHRIAHREFLRSLRHEPPTQLSVVGEVAAPEATVFTEAVALRELLRRLPTEQREAMLLHYLEGYTSAEIAQIVGAPARTVRLRLAQAREQLRQELGEGDLIYLNEPLAPMRQWAWLPLDQLYALETRLARGGETKEGEMERREFLRQTAAGAAALMLSEPGKEVVDGRLTQKLTLAFKATALSDLCDQLRKETGVHVTAGPSVADEKVTLFCKQMPLRDVMRQLSRPFGYAWTRSTRDGAYRYELVQDLRSQLLEEELRNRDRNEALLALAREIELYRPYLGLSPNDALARAQRAPESEKPLLETYADVGWAPIQMYFRLSPQELTLLRAGQELIFSEKPKPGERLLPADLKRGVLECNRYYRIIRQGDRLDVNSDTSDPRGARLADIPEVKAALIIRIVESEPGQFTLRGHAGAFIEQGPNHRLGWSTFRARPPYAVGRGRSYSPSVRVRTETPEPRDKALRTLVRLRPQPSGLAPQPPATGEASAAPEPKVTTADVLEALHRATGLPIVADFYTRLYEPNQVSAQGEPLYVLLDRLAETMRLRWRLEGESASPSAAEKRWLQFRSATYYHDRLKEVPNRLLTRWAEARRRHGMLPLDDLVEIACLPDAQQEGEEMYQGAVEWWGIPEWSLIHDRGFPLHVRFLAEFSPEQRRMMQSAEGLPFGKMSLAQQQGFLSRAIQGEPLRSFDELAGATLRVDYTQPGAFQWQKTGGHTPTRWVVRVEPGPTGRRVLIPPIRERTPEAALAAARRAFPPITPELLAAFRQSDPTLDADQILPQPGQIFPTEIDLVIVYIPGTATKRGIRLVRRGQGPVVWDMGG
jgi:RNA polymerase sigma-70 factor (ECF subfamily)